MSREALVAWQKEICENSYRQDPDFRHSVDLYLKKSCPHIDQELTDFADKVARELELLVIENNLPQNLPRIEHDDNLGRPIEQIIHHPAYEAAGNIIYGSRVIERLAKPGGLLEALVFTFIASQAGEAGHNCPVACTAGIVRVLQKVADFPRKDFFLEKLLDPSYSDNYTGAQFLTEIQGGSDVGLNQTSAAQDKTGNWRITGEKWFCSNADAELMLVIARFDPTLSGTKGLGLFLVPALLESGERNYYRFRRLKDKLGTRSMATAEIDFQGAYAIAMGEPKNGFKLVMENVLHISRLFNTFSVLGMARRAYQIAYAYAKHRIAFGEPILHYPLVQEHLVKIKAENTALIASIFATTKLQDDYDLGILKGEDKALLLRTLVNLNKYFSALLTVEHIHHSLDILAGNGAIESFSTIPRLLRDSIVCENWEGTHNTLRMQLLKDIVRYQVDQLYIEHLESQLQKAALEKNKKRIQSAISSLKNNLGDLKASGQELQSLKIKQIMDQMAAIYCAVHLLLEAEKGSHSKLQALEFFLLWHLENGVMYDQKYLNLIQEMCYIK